MPDTRWSRIDVLFHDALERPPAERDEWLSRACGGDDELEREVQALIRYDAAGPQFLEGSALAVAAAALGADRPGGMEGQRIGGYDVLEFLGAGGMGEVHRARDVRLGRDVALKMFENVASDDAVRRFEAEARSASVLNHPNIVTIYGVGDAGDTAFIAMELVQGRTLRHMFATSRCTPRQCIDLLLQLAEAVAAAHASGIVHRDLKPENVMVTTEGRIKVLDFGIAKPQRELWVSIAEQADDPSTVTPLEGTVAYMSPEQAAGGAVGPSSDQFAFGVIAFEMVSGAHPFARTDRKQTLQAIVDQPAPALQVEAILAPLVPVIERCLRKDPSKRYPSSDDVVAALRGIKEADGATATMTRRQALWVGGLAALSAIGGGAVWRLNSQPARRTSLVVLPFSNRTRDEGTEYLCNGLTETLIRQLALAPSLSVVARATAYAFKDASRDPRIAGQQLGTDAVLSGDIRRQGNRLQISAELIDSRTGARLWGDEFDRPVADVLAVQNDLAEAIIRKGLGVELSAAERQRLLRAFTTDAAAYEQFLLAIHHFRLTTEQDYLRARDLLTAVVARDPRFTLALVTLASTYAVMAVDGFSEPSESWPQTDALVARALAVDADLPDAHAEAASAAFFYRWDWAETERRWEKALRSNRGAVQSELMSARALQLWAIGRGREAFEAARAARQLDPLSAQAAVREADLLAAQGRDDDAVSAYENIIREQPLDARAYLGLAEAKRSQKRFDEALSVRRRAHLAAGDVSLEELFETARGAEGYAAIVRASVRNEIERLRERRDAGVYVCPLDCARAHAQLDDPSPAWPYLAAALEERDAGLVMLKVDPAWERVREDERFKAAVARVGIP